MSTNVLEAPGPHQSMQTKPSPSVTSKEIEANWIEFLRAGQLSLMDQRDAFLHTCAECARQVEVSGSSIRMAKNANTKLNLPCGHTTSVPV